MKSIPLLLVSVILFIDLYISTRSTQAATNYNQYKGGVTKIFANGIELKAGQIEKDTPSL